ncbi:phosphotransferase family protein [Streptomyces antimycoticus]|uniref:phosphotransferase family protein n=1 Tax=Streptomyces antimycoticus TaxID=68175 RepID=UPI000A3B7616|nr:aminoglycoside phosphotransferase family protein [Streptomyces antimycoticus]
MTTSHDVPWAAVLRRTPEERTLRWACDVVGPGTLVLSSRALGGGRSHANHALSLRTGAGVVHDVVIRRWARPNWRETDPDFTVEREAATLELLAAAGLRAPRLIAADATAAACDVPTLMMTLLPGGPPTGGVAAEPALRQLARAAVEIHSVGAPSGRRISPYRPYHDLRAPVPPRHAAAPGDWERAFAVVAAGPPSTAACFIHRDFHPGNTLWRDGTLSAVVDWTNASWGHESVDVAHMRWNLAAAHDLPVADRFLEAYRAERGGGFVHDPYWDLRTLVDLVPDDPVYPLHGEPLRRIERYLSRLLSVLGQ